MRDRRPEVFVGAWGAVDPLKGEQAIGEAERAAKEDGVLGFHFHPIMGRFRVDDPIGTSPCSRRSATWDCRS